LCGFEIHEISPWKFVAIGLAGKILALVEIMVLGDLCQGRPSKAKATNFGLRATAKARINITGSVKLVADG